MDIVGKKLLVLGANPETAGFVRKACEMGVFTIVTDYNPQAYAKRFASKSYDIDAVDLSALSRMALQEKIDGVMVGVAEALLPTYEKLCSRLSLPCYGTMRLFDLLTDKSKFKQVCRRHLVPVVQEYPVSNPPTEAEIAAIPLPAVVKPVDNRSSRGISVCYTKEELYRGMEKALEYSNRKRLIIEKYMTGAEVVVYYIIQDGEPSLVGMCDRYTNKEQFGVAQLPTAYIFPSMYLERYLADTDQRVRSMLRAIGIQNGTLFIQSFIEHGEVRFYESGYRLNGAQEHYIVNANSGIDAKELMVNFALTGRMSDTRISSMANPHFKKWSCKLSPLVRAGQIRTIAGLEAIAKIPEVISINPSYDETDIVTSVGTLRQIVCRFYIVAETKERLAEVIRFIHSNFTVLDNDGNNMIMTPFDTQAIV